MLNLLKTLRRFAKAKAQQRLMWKQIPQEAHAKLPMRNFESEKGPRTPQCHHLSGGAHEQRAKLVTQQATGGDKDPWWFNLSQLSADSASLLEGAGPKANWIAIRNGGSFGVLNNWVFHQGTMFWYVLHPQLRHSAVMDWENDVWPANIPNSASQTILQAYTETPKSSLKMMLSTPIPVSL